MKEKIKRLIRQMSTWPIIGRLIHWGVVFIRLPSLWSQFLDLNRRQQLFETEQLPNLLEQLSDLNRRVVSGANQDRDNLVSSVPGALREMARDLADMRVRLDGVAHGAGSSKPSDPPAPPVANDAGLPRVLNSQKFDAQRAASPKLWLGDVLEADDTYLTVDHQAAPGVDIVADAADLPFDAAQVHEIRSFNWLQRYSHEQLRDDVLPRLVSFLKPDGVFYAKVPDSRAAMHAFLGGEISAEQLRRVLFGNQATPAGSHLGVLTILSAESWAALLTEAGLREVQVKEAAVGKDGEMGVVGELGIEKRPVSKAGATTSEHSGLESRGTGRFEFEIVARR